uniref:Transmembrane protein n=1 Tax=Heterorhabditis bacteriophora TaxID=37862 RepID=A0A1I7WB89_HETBA
MKEVAPLNEAMRRHRLLNTMLRSIICELACSSKYYDSLMMVVLQGDSGFTSGYVVMIVLCSMEIMFTITASYSKSNHSFSTSSSINPNDLLGPNCALSKINDTCSALL